MKKTSFLILGLIFMAIGVSRSQSISGPGWFSGTNSIDPTEVSTESFGGGSPSLQSYPSVAEADTAEIEALARGLENDPKRIFDYVHDHIRHVLYFGAKKGAQLTLLERSGNDFDQCALLVSLLRAAGYSPVYEFGVLQMPYDSPTHDDVDVHHWLGTTVVNTNWTNTKSFFGTLLGNRGYPGGAFFTFASDTNTLAFHRVWVKLAISGTNYYLDPAFKVSEPITGIDLHTAMGLDTNTLVTAAAGTNTADYVQSLNEGAFRNKLRDYTTNLLNYLQFNSPNASVEEIMGGQQITSSVGNGLSQSLPFTPYTDGSLLPVVDWDNEPTNLMSTLSVSFAGATNQWYIPALQGQRLTLIFDTNGMGQLWQEDTMLMQSQTSGPGSTVGVVFSINHPFGTWSTSSNTLVNSGLFDQSDAIFGGTPYQRTNATYALLYGFEMDNAWLQKRQTQLNAYRAQGLSDTSRQVVSETLNVMGLNWLIQTEMSTRILAVQTGMLNQNHHRLGRMGQEKGQGYYIDTYMQLSGLIPAGLDGSKQLIATDLSAYFSSALEHGLIEQMQSSNLVAASTVKMLELGSTNGLKIFLATSNNWNSITNQLTNYSTSFLYSAYISQGFNLLLPANGFENIAGAGSWGGWGAVAIGNSQGLRATAMVIAGQYFGGYVSDDTGQVNPFFVDTQNVETYGFFNPPPVYTFNFQAGDPVNMSDGSLAFSKTDLSLGQTEPRGIHFNRFYSPNRRNSNIAGMADGWTHNYNINLAEISDPRIGLGASTPQQMASMLVASRAAIELYSNQPNPKNWMLTALIAKWGIDQLDRNTVSVTLGNDALEFVHQPDGTFTPPASSTMSLAKVSSLYNLSQRHGNTFKFDASNRLTNMVDQYTNVSLSLTYNTNSLVSTVKDWKNRQFTFNYTGSPQRLTSITDGTRTINYGYGTNFSSQGDLLSATDPEGKTNTFIYDTNHQMTADLDALGRVVTSNIYDGFGRVVTQYSQGDANKMWQFFWSGNVNSEVDPVGGRQRYFYDDKFRAIAVQDALGNLSQMFYDGQDQVVKSVSPMNETNQMVFDGNHNLILSIDPLGFTNQFVYDTQNNLKQSVDPNGNTNNFGYNAKFQLTGTTNAAGNAVTFAYSSTDGSLSSKTDAGGTTSYGYDSFGQLNLITYPGSLGSEGFLNSSNGNVLTHTNARGFATTFQYNLRNQLTNTTAPTNLTAKVTYDSVGNLASMTDARGFSITNTWSSTRHLLATTLPSTPQGVPVITNVYDSRDWLARTLNPLQQTTQFTNDLAGRLLASIDPLLRKNTFGYDNDGRRVAVTNAALEASSQLWNTRGEMLKTTDAATNIVQRAYDSVGNQTLLTNRNGYVWQFQFDTANRLTNTTTPLSRSTSQVWNNRGLLQSVTLPSGHSASLTYDAKGRLANRTDNVAATTYLYDADNNRANVVESGLTNSWTFDAYDRVSSCTDTTGNVIQYRYDANGNLTNLIYPGGRTVKYFYDSLNRLTSVTDWASRQTTFTYDLASKLKSVTRPNGTSRTLNYDAAGETTNIIEQAASHAPIAFFALSNSAAGRVAWEFAGPLPQTFTPPARTMTFDHDNRLASVNSQNVTNDLDGNMTWGPLTNGTFTNYTFDARNRLLGAAGLGFAYDPIGNRTDVTNGTNVTVFVVNPNAALPQVLMRIRGSVTNYYVYGAGLLYEVNETATTTNVLTYHFDSRGSTVALTDTNGNITDQIQYSVYGMVTFRAGTNDTPFLYNGRYGVQTDASGLLYMRARYYNPYICRFVNSDPSGFSGGLNWFAYADGNPISEVDPFGLGAVGEEGLFSWIGRQFDSFVTRLFEDPFNLPNPYEITRAGVDNVVSGAFESSFGQGYRPMGTDPNGSAAAWANVDLLGLGVATSLPAFGEGATTFTISTETSAAETGVQNVFWSGGRAAEDAARTFANANNGVIIGDTAAGSALAQSTAGIPWSQARPQWLSLSEDFARSASGEVNVFQNARGISVDSIWRNEYQILMQNPNVTGINFNIVMPGGSVVPVR